MKKLSTFLILVFASLTALAQDNVFTGRVLNDEDEPLERALVSVYNEQEDLLYSTFTDSDGWFETNIQLNPVMGIGDQVDDTDFSCIVYPNPLKSAPLFFSYRSAYGAKPEIRFTTLEGKAIEAGSTINAGTYVYHAIFPGSKVIRRSGLFSVLVPMPLKYEFRTMPIIATHEKLQSANNRDKNSHQARRQAALQLAEDKFWVEIQKDEYITLKEEADTRDPDLAGRTFALETAPPPVADFDINSPEGVREGVAVGFDAAKSIGANEEALTYAWSFGDGSLGGQEKIPYMYMEPGTYTVNLTVTGNYGARSSISKTLDVAAWNPTMGKAAILGLVTDGHGVPLADVEVKIKDRESPFFTNQAGEVGINGFPTGKPQIIEVSKNGFVPEFYKLYIPENEKQGQFRIALAAEQPAITLTDAELGGSVEGLYGATVSLPVEGLRRMDGTLVTGSVDVHITPVDISDEEMIEAFPGDFAGITFDGPAPLILSYGTADYTFRQNGEKLQLAEGKVATIDIPIYVAEDENGVPLKEGDEYPLWSYNEQAGVWIQEGMGTVATSDNSPTGLVLRGEVGHFSWWNHDVAPDPYWTVPECKIKDKNGLPTLEIPNGGICKIDGRLSGPVGPRGRPSVNGCCTPLPLPPGLDVILTGTGGNGRYKGSVVVNGAAGTTQSVIIPMEPVADPGKGGPIAADTVFVSTIDEEGEIDIYTFEAEIGKTYFISVAPGDGSNLEGMVELRDPDNLPMGTAEFRRSQTAVINFEAAKAGTYFLSVDGTANEPGSYQLSLQGLISISMNSETEGQIFGQPDIRSYAFEASEGDIINLALGSDNLGGSVYLRLFGPDGTRLKNESGRTVIQTDVYELPQTGIYKVTVEAASASSEGAYLLGLTSVEEPERIVFENNFINIEGEINLLGKKKFYIFDGQALEWYNMGIFTPASLASYARLYRPSAEAFHLRRGMIKDIRTTHYSDGYRFNETSPFALTESGEYLIKIDPATYSGYSYESQKGTYELYLAKPGITSVAMNSETESILDNVLNKFRDFKLFTFNGTEGQLINAVFASDDVSGRVYIELYKQDGGQLKSVRATGYAETGVMALPATETYTVLIRGVDAGSHGSFTLGVTEIEEPEELVLTSPFIFTEGDVSQLGKKKFYKFTAAEGDRINFGLYTEGSLAAHARLLRPGNNPFYSRSQLKDLRTTHYNNAYRFTESDPFTLTAGGEYIVELDPNSIAGSITKKGPFKIYLAKPEPVPATVNTVINANFSKDMEVFDQFHHYSLSAEAGETIFVKFNWATSGGRIYIAVFAPDGSQLYRQRVQTSSNITLPESGTYIVEIEAVDNNSVGDYTVEIVR